MSEKNQLICSKCNKSYVRESAYKTHIESCEGKKKTKKSIGTVLKFQVWTKWIGKDQGSSKCLCCGINTIHQIDFHCGHILAEANGGETTVENMKPICQKCNLSMGTQDMNDFMKGFVEIKDEKEEKSSKESEILIKASLLKGIKVMDSRAQLALNMMGDGRGMQYYHFIRECASQYPSQGPVYDFLRFKVLSDPFAFSNGMAEIENGNSKMNYSDLKSAVDYMLLMTA